MKKVQVRVERRTYDIPREVYDDMKYKDIVYLMEDYRPVNPQVEYKVYYV